MFKDVPSGIVALTDLKAGQQFYAYDVVVSGIQADFFERAGSTYKYKGNTYRGENHLVDTFAKDAEALDVLAKEITDYILKVRE